MPPSDVVAWISAGGTAGTTEHRSDTYYLNGLHDVGLKRRFGSMAEVKIRGAVGPPVVLGAGLEAPLEEWSKRPVADGDQVWDVPDSHWIDVNKTILTRTFMLADGEMVGPASRAGEMLAGCDVEIATVTMGAVEAWTLAFEAFGPRQDRRAAILDSWRMLAGEADLPPDLGSRLGCVAGYPQWLDLALSGRLDKQPRRVDPAD